MAQNRNNFTSLHVFRSYLADLPDGSTDASKIHSPQCYQAWLKVRGSRHCEQEAKRFQRALTNHLSGVDGRCPFTPKEERAILKVLRRKMLWPCFLPPLTIGSTGYRSKGHHEKESELNQGKQTPSTDGSGGDSPEISPELLPSKKRLRVSPWSSPEPPDAGGDGGDDTCAAQYTALAHRLQQFHQRFEGFGIDVWRTVLAELRFVLFPVASWATRTNEASAAELCERTSKQHPLASVLVVNFSSPEQLVLAQNLSAKRRFGAQVGRFCGDVLQGVDLCKLVQALAGSSRPQPAAHKDELVTLRIDPASSLLVVVVPDLA